MVRNINEQLVSVIIPTYGRPETLQKAIDSVLYQNYLNIEIIIVDDNNPNTEDRKSTENLINRLYSHVENIVYLKHNKNKNGSAARNTGFSKSKGDYICFLDDDDFFYQYKVQKQVKFLESNLDFDAVYCGYRVNGENYSQYFEGQLISELLLMDYQPVTSSIMFRREALIDINGFDESFVRHQDYELMLRFFEKHQITYIDEVLINKGRTDDANIVRGRELEKLKEYFLDTFNQQIVSLENEKPGIKNKIYSRHYSYVFLTHINHGFYKRGLRVFAQYIKKFPLTFIKDIYIRLVDYYIN